NSTKRVANETSVECGLHVRVTDWLHFFYHVINYTTIPMLFFWPAIILVLPDFLFTFEDKEDAEKAPEKTGKEDTSQTPKSKNSRTNAKHHREGLEESFVLLSMSETEGSYGTITEAPPPQPPPDLGQKTHDSKRESDNVTSTPSTSDQNDDHTSQKTNASKRESEKVTLGETNTPSTSDQSDAVRSLIPVDDVSPITIRRLMRYCTGKSSVFCSDYSKLLFLYYILLFIIYYYKLFFSMLYKDHDLRRAINLPGARFEEWCKRCLKKCKQYLGYETNKRPAAGENGNTHAEQGNDSTDHSNAGNKNARAEQEIDSTDHSNAGNENTHAEQGIDSTDHSNAGIVCADIWSFVLALIWASFVTIVACLSCRFVSRMTGFVIVGLFWNSKETIPYITFLYVLMNHTSCCYSSIQSRYKEIKVMISKQLRSKGSGEKIGEDGKLQDKETIFYGDNIPLDLFWFVCNDGKVLPLVDELCLMFVSVLAFAFVVFLAVAAIMFLGEENSAFPDVVTALLQAGAILISGKLPEWVFKKLIKEERFIDDEKIEKQKMVKQAVKNWHEKNPAGEV
ncbi:unnamed protein product, partial [Porites lobata]